MDLQLGVFDQMKLYYTDKSRSRRQSKLEEFAVDMDDFAQTHRSWHAAAVNPNVEQVSNEYLGEYTEGVKEPRKKRAPLPTFLSFDDLVRLKREIEEDEDDVGEEYEYEVYDDRRRKRLAYSDEDEQRQQHQQHQPARCNSDVTTLNVGCSTADRMELQSDCVDDYFVTGEARYLPPAYFEDRIFETCNANDARDQISLTTRLGISISVN